MLLLLILYCAILAPESECVSNTLPPYLPRCCIENPNVGSCILDAVNTLRPNISKGIEEIGIPSYHPLILESYNVTQISDLVNYTGSFWNYTIRGMNNYDITDIQYDNTTMTFRGRIDLDPLSLVSRYLYSGRLLFIRVEGDGVVAGSLGPISGSFEIGGRLKQVDNEDYFDPSAIRVKLDIDDMILQVGGLFDGDAEQAALTNELLNMHSKMIIGAISPAFEKISESYVTRYLKWFTKQYPFRTLFPCF